MVAAAHRLWHLLIVVLMLAVMLMPATMAIAQLYTEHRVISTVQDALVWTGHYKGLTDGDLGPRSITAFADFQRQNGWSVSSDITPDHLRRLFERAEEMRRRVQFNLIDDDRARTTIGLPHLIVTKRNDTQRGSRYSSPSGEIEVIVGRFTRDEGGLKELFNRVLRSGRITSFAQRVWQEHAFYVSGEDATKHYYYTGKVVADEVRGLSISYPKLQQDLMERIVIAVVNSFHNPIGRYPITESAPQPDIARHGGRTAPYSATPTLPHHSSPVGPIGAGTGFFVDATGHLMTSDHVVNGCSSLDIRGHGTGQVVRRDPANDLAIIKVAPAKSIQPVKFRTEELDLAEKILVVGYPLPDTLAASLNVTEGIVSSLQGIRGDNRYVQITAPVQPGNSGGPLLDYAGRVSGIVTAKLNDLRVLATRGTVPENIAFALRASYAIALLRTARITPEVGDTFAPRTGVDIAKEATDSTVLIVCIGRPLADPQQR